MLSAIPACIFCAAVSVADSAPTAVATDPQSKPSALTAPPAPGEVERLIAELGDPAYEKRLDATRRLVALGMHADAALTSVAQSDDLERALRAKRILEISESVYFAGCKVHLTFEPSQARWDEPVDLVVEIHNQAPFTAVVPFELAAQHSPTNEPADDKSDADDLFSDRNPAEPTAKPALQADARQVAGMLDIAEWLKVIGPENKSIDLRVDDIAADPQVMAVVGDRLESGPTSRLGAGETRRIRIPAFNRGWARYPLLEAGEYSAVLNYVPPWTDEVLAAAEVGLTVSNTANVEIRNPAPPEVSRSGTTATVKLTRDGDFIVARLTNHCELPIVVNLNFGPGAPFASAQWEIHSEADAIRIPAARSNPTWSDFTAAGLVELEPGKDIELARISTADVRKRFPDDAPGREIRSGASTIRFTYVNTLDRAWQLRESMSSLKDPNVPPVLREPLPRRLLVLHPTSEPIPVSP